MTSSGPRSTTLAIETLNAYSCFKNTALDILVNLIVVATRAAHSVTPHFAGSVSAKIARHDMAGSTARERVTVVVSDTQDGVQLDHSDQLLN